MNIKTIIKKKFQRFLELQGYTINALQKDSIIDNDECFLKIYDKARDFTMLSKERMFALYLATKYIINNNIQGDFVECGVWKGGSVLLVALTLKELNILDRKIYLYDTFEGMSKPSVDDYRIMDKTKALKKWVKNRKKDHNKWGYASLSEVKRNMGLSNYPVDNLVFVKGKVEDTIPKILPKEIALLRLDTDWYESTKHELENLYPVLVQNGVLIIDDYGCWAGSQKATKEYFKDKEILLNRTDCTGVIGIKIGKGESGFL